MLCTCFFCGKLLGYNTKNIVLNMLSSLVILIVIAVSTYFTMTNPKLIVGSAIFRFLVGAVFMITTYVSNVFKISQTICLNIFVFLPYVAFTIGAAVK